MYLLCELDAHHRSASVCATEKSPLNVPPAHLCYTFSSSALAPPPPPNPAPSLQDSVLISKSTEGMQEVRHSELPTDLCGAGMGREESVT